MRNLIRLTPPTLRCAIVLLTVVACAPPTAGLTIPGNSTGDSVFSRDSPPGATLAFVDVNVVTMTKDAALLRQTVVVRDGAISALGPVAETPVPRGAYIVNGSGRLYLAPGLADMHVHIFDRDELWLFLANGITTVRNMHGTPLHLAWRDSIARGLILGPRMVTAGPILDGDPPMRSTNVVVRTAGEANAAVNEQLDAGYDFIKIYDNVSPTAYAAINAAARARGRKVVGHLPTPVGLGAAVSAASQHGVEHAEELLPFFSDGRLSASTPDSLRAVARRFAAAGVWLDPTIGVYDSALRQSRNWAAELARSEMAYVNPATLRNWGWQETGNARSGVPREIERYTRTRNFMVQYLIPAFHEAGVQLLAGSDSPIASLVPGFALLDELDLLAECGLSPFDVMRAATTNAASFLEREQQMGPLAVGRVADLLLLNDNPLLSVHALRSRKGVVAAGRWFSQPGLQARLDSLARRYRQH